MLYRIPMSNLQVIRLGLCSFLLSGCASDGYLANRGRDLADCFTLAASVGLELSAGFHATDLAHVLVGAGAHAEAGIVAGRVGGASVLTLGLPFTPFLEGGILHGRYVFTETAGDWKSDDVEDECYLIHALGVENTSPGPDLWHSLDVEVSGMALLGARAGFSPGELVDFLCGLFGADPIGDDGGPAQQQGDEPAIECARHKSASL